MITRLSSGTFLLVVVLLWITTMLTPMGTILLVVGVSYTAVQDNVQDVTNGDVFDALGINTDLSNANTFKENEDETV